VSCPAQECARVAPAPRIQAVLFDALGTLIELRPPAPLLVRGLKERHGLDVEQAEAERALLAEMSFYRLNNQLASDADGLRELRRRCAEVLRAQLPASAQALDLHDLNQTLLASLRFELYPDVRGALEALRARGLRLAIVSNWDISLHDVLNRTGLARLVDAAVTSAEVGSSKPAPEIFAAALERVRCAPAHALHVGDSPVDDVRGARAAGVAPILLRRGTRAGVGAVRVDDGGSGDEVPVIASLSELAALVPAAAA